jgi:hypothetical protein
LPTATSRTPAGHWATWTHTSPVAHIHWLDGHVVLAERLESPRFTKVEVYSPRNILHAFRLREPAEVDAEFVDWLTRAYAVGRQHHLHPR